MMYQHSSLQTKNLFISSLLLISSCNLWSIVQGKTDESRAPFIFPNAPDCKRGSTPQGCETWYGAVLGGEADGATLREFFATVTTSGKEATFRKSKWELIAKGSKPKTSITHLYAEIMFKGGPGTGADKSIGYFGPLSIRRESIKKWKKLEALPGYMSRVNSINVKFRYFVPKLTDLVKGHLGRIYYLDSATKTNFDAKLKVHANCYTESSAANCEPDMTPGSYGAFIAMYPKNEATLSGKLEDVQLSVPSNILSFKYKWADKDEKDKFWEKNTNCAVKYVTVLYESAGRKGINSNIRPILAKVGGEITKKLEDSLDVSVQLDNTASNRNLLGQLEFLSRNAELSSSESNNYYKGWESTGGLSIAFSVCDCANQSKASCREYIHEEVAIDGSIPHTADS